MRKDGVEMAGHPGWFKHTLVSGAQTDLTIKAGPGLVGGFVVTVGEASASVNIFDGPVVGGDLILSASTGAVVSSRRIGPIRATKGIHVQTISAGGLLRTQILWR